MKLLYVLFILAFSFVGTFVLTLIAQFAIGALWHPVPFWPLFAAIFVISSIAHVAKPDTT